MSISCLNSYLSRLAFPQFIRELCKVSLSHSCPPKCTFSPRVQMSSFFPLKLLCKGSKESDMTTSVPETPLSVQNQFKLPFIFKKGAILVPMIRGTQQLYASHIPPLPLRLPRGPTSALIISNPSLGHHLIIISGQWDTLIALSTPLDWRCGR